MFYHPGAPTQAPRQARGASRAHSNLWFTLPPQIGVSTTVAYYPSAGVPVARHRPSTELSVIPDLGVFI